ncbi:MAG: hypothetical protein NW226_22585 [Microscillaceae bacterium]|nr:hypothetical protein [Microscillaceae bacterium]
MFLTVSACCFNDGVAILLVVVALVAVEVALEATTLETPLAINFPPAPVTAPIAADLAIDVPLTSVKDFNHFPEDKFETTCEP